MNKFNPISDHQLMTIECQLKYYGDDASFSSNDVGSLIAKIRQIENELAESNKKSRDLENKLDNLKLASGIEKTELAEHIINTFDNMFNNIKKELKNELNERFGIQLKEIEQNIDVNDEMANDNQINVDGNHNDNCNSESCNEEHCDDCNVKEST